MLTFKKLWDNHPTVESLFDDAPCKIKGKRAYKNQCAIRLGHALITSGVKMNSFTGAKCWHNHKPAHILRAEELAKWLKSPFSPVKNMMTFKGSEGFKQISGKKGIIFFKDYYGPGNQGDHIDLWNGSRLTKMRTWVEFSFRSGRHYAKATIWFWPMH